MLLAGVVVVGGGVVTLTGGAFEAYFFKTSITEL